MTCKDIYLFNKYYYLLLLIFYFIINILFAGVKGTIRTVVTWGRWCMTIKGCKRVR